MRLTWTLEADDSVVLRKPDAHRSAVGVVKHRQDDWGFVAILLEPGLPACGPYKSCDEAFDWLVGIVRLLKLPEWGVDDLEFTDPPKPWRQTPRVA